MSEFMRDNDDDLFDYDPEQEESTVKQNYSDNNSSFGEQIKSALNDIVSDALDKDKFRLAAAFNISTQKFIDSVNEPAFSKTIRVVLDKLTNGDFTLLNLLHRSEMRISRRMDFLLLFKEFLSEEVTDFTNNDIIKDIFGFLQIDATELYVKTCYQSTYRIVQHALEIDRALYKTLCRRLNLEPKQFLLGNHDHAKYPEANVTRQQLYISSEDPECAHHSVSLAHYEKDLVFNVYKALCAEDLNDNISSAFNCNVHFVNYEE